MRSEWISYQGKPIFFCHFDNMDINSLREEVAACDDLICGEPEFSVLVLSDLRGTPGSPETTNIFKKSTAKTRSHIKKSAVVGVGLSGPRKILFDIVRSKGRHM